MKLAVNKRFVLILGLSLWFAAGLALDARGASAESQSRGVELLSRAQQSYEAGSYSDAADMIESAFKAGLTGELAARALFLRAEISEKKGALANALQDYSNALWMEALPAPERKTATEGKARVMAALGLSEGTAGQASAASSAPVGSSSSSDGILGFFSGVFSGAESQPASRTPVANVAAASETPAQESSLPARKAAIAQAEAKPVKVAHTKPTARIKSTAQPSSSLAVASAPSEILIVFGSASNEASGRATAANIKAQLADILIHRDLDVTPRGNGGYQIQAGPYQSKRSANALCSAIKERGIQCKVTP